jgi:hypothetical protein
MLARASFTSTWAIGLVSALALVTRIVSACSSESQPNPIFEQYPDVPTGTVNGTTLIIPIDLTLARSIIPSQYPILTNAYRSLLVDFPQDKYPVRMSPIMTVVSSEHRSARCICTLSWITISASSASMVFRTFRYTQILTTSMVPSPNSQHVSASRPAIPLC